MITVYTVRHGESTCNAEKRFSGWSATPLTERGKQDAAEIGKRLQGIPWEKVFCSDLPRAMETCQIALPGESPVYDRRLRELNVGPVLQDRYYGECFEQYGEELKAARYVRDYRSFGGDNRADQVKTVAGFMDELARTVPEGNIAVFSHDGTIKCMLEAVLGQPVTVTSVDLNNCKLAVFTYSDRWRLHAWNV